MAEAGIKVLMMGGRRCGKTSALASIYNQMTEGPITRILTVTDQSNERVTLSNKTLELKNFIRKQGNRHFLVDENPTKDYGLYVLRLQIPGTHDTMDLTFRDTAGEFFDSNNVHSSEIKEYMKECDVFVVAVDSTYLMAGEDEENEAANVTDQINKFFTEIDTQKPESKLVIFVPIKCEKWIRERKADALTEKVEKTYEKAINFLRKRNNTEIWVIPIQTAGDIVFSALKPSYYLVDHKKGTSRRCTRITDTMVTMENGENHILSDNEMIQEDSTAIFNGTSIQRRSPWYQILPDIGMPSPAYRPVNCEQLPLHILRFMFKKKKDDAFGGLLGKLFNTFFGSITKEEMSDVMARLSDAHLIKDSGDGIKELTRKTYAETGKK